MKKFALALLKHCTEKKKTVILVSSLLLIFSLSLLFVFSPTERKFWNEFDEWYGQVIFIGLLCFFIGKYFFKWKMHVALLALSVVLFYKSGGRSLEIYRENEQFKKVEEQLRLIKSFYASYDTENEVIANPKYDYYSNAEYGEAADALNILRASTKFNIEESQMLRKAIADIDLKEVLKLEKLADHDEMARTRIKLKNLIDILDKSQERTRVKLNELDKRAKSGSRHFYQAFLKRKEQQGTAGQEHFEALKNMYLEVDRFLSFLNERRSNYILENQQLVFSTNEDLGKFNVFVEQIIRYGHELELVEIKSIKVQDEYLQINSKE